MKSNPWNNRFRPKWADSELDKVIRIPVKRVPLGDRSPEHDMEMLRAAMNSFFLPSDQIRVLVRKILDVGDSYAQLNYEDKDWIVRVINEPEVRTGDPLPALCLTGPAGCGKSAALLAIQRAIDHVVRADLPGLQGVQLRPAWFITLKDGLAMQTLLGPSIAGVGYESTTKPDDNVSLARGSVRRIRDSTDLLKLARRISWRDGVCLIFVDEWQFVTQGDANARATRILLQLMGIGPRLIYCCNYSLGHKLKRRNQEDRHRLLAQQLFLDPEQASTDDWKNYLKELQKTAPNVFIFDVDAFEVEIHQLTFGIKRAVVALLVAAYGIARRRKKHPEVGMDDIRRAYLSTSYTVFREDVEILFKQQISNQRLRDDLWCPFERNTEPNNIVVATKAIKEHDSRVEQCIFNEFLPPDERVKSPRGKLNTSQTAGKNVIRLRGTKSMKQQLLDGADEFDKF